MPVGRTGAPSILILMNKGRVAEAGLEFLKLMNAKVEIDPRPTIYLTENETI